MWFTKIKEREKRFRVERSKRYGELLQARRPANVVRIVKRGGKSRRERQGEFPISLCYLRVPTIVVEQ